MLSLERIQDKVIQLLSKIPEFDKSQIEVDIKDYFVYKILIISTHLFKLKIMLITIALLKGGNV